MKNVGQRLSIRRPRRSVALALLLSAALLLCHGVYGAYHQVHQTSTGVLHQHEPSHTSHEGHGMTTGAHSAGTSEGQGGGCSDCVTYSAVLLVLSLGLLLALPGASHLRTSTPTPLLSPLGPAPIVLYTARGPMLPNLQVFRL